VPERGVSAIVLAAGRGKRLGAGGNKAFVSLLGRPLLSYALAAFSRSRQVDEVLLVVARGEEEEAREVAKGMARVVAGGERRQDSALAGVEASRGRIVLVHDAARPFPSEALLRRVIEGTLEHQACVPVVDITDTLRYREAGGTLRPGTIDREGLLRMQTPQGFERDLYWRHLREAKGALLDDAEAVLSCGVPIATVPGEAMNLKVTTQDDLALAEVIARGLGDLCPPAEPRLE
jgi:2-C-methyl-D-erythritol 4-phosphate cytidylyltransferase